MAGIDRLLDEWREPPHDGYRDGEIPRYRECDECGQIVRSDRTDLMAEHEQSCAGRRREE